MSRVVDKLAATPDRHCSRCEYLPEPLPQKGVLYLSPPIIHTRREIRQYLQTLNMPFEEQHEGIFAVPFERSGLNVLCSDFLCHVSSLELRDTKCLILGAGEEFTIHHLTRMQPLEWLVARIEGEWLVDLLGKGRMEAHFQPIVYSDTPDRTYAYECLIRGRDEDGSLIMPAQVFSIAQAADLMFYLDRTCRMTAIRDAKKHDLTRPIFVNFNPTTIYNPSYCLQTTLRVIEETGISPENVIFEVVESDEVRDIEHLLTILRFYRDHGFRIALDDLGAGFSSLTLLTRLKPDFIKLDMGLIRNVDTDEYKSVITANLLDMAAKLGVATIAEGVETKEEYHWLANHGATYMQGYLFAKPAAPPLSVEFSI